MKTQEITKTTIRKFGIGLSSLALLLATISLLAASAQAQPAAPAKPPVDPATHAAHVAAGTHPAAADTSPNNADLAQQLTELKAKAAQLEAALAKNNPRPPATATPALGAMPGMVVPAAPMAGMSGTAPGGMKPAGGMMGMMDKMMGMMDKMMSMGGGAMPSGAPVTGAGAGGMGGGGMGMGMMQSEMGGMGGGAMPGGAPTAGMSGGGAMGMDKMEMAGMMGMGARSSGAAGTIPQSALPGFPGASHLYHIGATDFFLDHPQHIALTTEQKAALNKAKEQALLAKSTADRAIQQAEQELWTLTAADQPDIAAIETKIGEIGKLAGDERLAFIRAVGEASKLLTDEQRKILTGFAPPAPAGAMPAGGMKDM